MQEDIDFLEASFETYMMDHLEKIGGFTNLKLMTEAELEQRHDEGVTDLFYAMEKRGYRIQNPRIKQMVEEKYCK